MRLYLLKPRLKQSTIYVVIFISYISFLVPTAQGKDQGSMYEDSTLTYWQGRYSKGIKENFYEVIIPKLTAEERRKLSGVKFEFPLRGPDDSPFTFYSMPSAVTMPIFSIKFFDDLMVANAWLNRNGYSPETAYQYISMLKYKNVKDFGGRYPEPLGALKIPNNALDDPNVDSLANKLLDSAIIYILLHELGHVFYDHPGYGPEVPRENARLNEDQADRFAIEIMRRMNAQPTGMMFVFQAFAYGTPNRGDYKSDSEYQAELKKATHPLTEDRMRRIAEGLRAAKDDFAREYKDLETGRANIEYIAEQIDLVAEILGDRDIQRLISESARRTTLASLAPKRHGEMIGTPEDLISKESLEPFHGVYEGNLSMNGELLPVTLILRRNGKNVTGQYSYGVGSGNLIGIVEGDQLFYKWQEGGSSGSGHVKALEAGERIDGTWGNGESWDNGGTWDGKRIKKK